MGERLLEGKRFFFFFLWMCMFLYVQVIQRSHAEEPVADSNTSAEVSTTACLTVGSIKALHTNYTTTMFQGS